MSPLRALSAGRGLPLQRFTARTHSVFQHACNLRLVDGRLVTLLPTNSGNLPQGIRLQTPDKFDFRDYFQPGQPLACRAGTLRATDSPFAAELRLATLWPAHEGSNVQAGKRLNDKQAYAGWQLAWEMLWTIEADDDHRQTALAPAAGPVKAQIFKRVNVLLVASRQLQLAAASGDMRRLVGTGPGLTPAGDDFIVGFLGALWRMAAPGTMEFKFTAALAGAVSQASNRTNDISRSFLECAARGQISERLSTLTQAIVNGEDLTAVGRATAAALDEGHSSGAAGVFGLLAGLWVWRPPGAWPEYPYLQQPTTRFDLAEVFF